MSELEFHPLTRDRLPDLAKLFGQGGDPKWCWCSFFRVRNADFAHATADTNRQVLERAVATTATDGRNPGLIAYREGEPIGWVSLGPRDDYERLKHSKILAPIDDRPVWSIVCFVVSRAWRGRGVATALLGAAMDHARAHGATTIEAYPIDPSRGRVSAASAYQGSLSMFEKAGFRVVERRQWNATAPVRPIVRLEL